MKQENEYLETSHWYKKEISDPYQVIAEFFSRAAIFHHRKVIKEVLQAACTGGLWRKNNPGNLLFYFEGLESVINAAYLLNKEEKKSPLDIGKADLFNPNLYCGWYADTTEWDYFPRTLSLKEYVNPYLVFKRFFKYQSLPEWKQILHDLFEYALLKSSMLDLGIVVDTLSVYFHLAKLVEAAHLIDVREITHIGGTIKNKSGKPWNR